MSGRTIYEESKIPREHYVSLDYINPEHLASLSEQIIRILRFKPENVLEIGIGNGFVSSFLRSAGIRVTTIDINPSLYPDVVGDACRLDTHFKVGEFDCILCAEVLEHMPIEQSVEAVKSIAFVCGRKALISLPESQYRLIDIQARVFLRFRRKLSFDLNLFKSRPAKKISPSHHWEINSSDDTTMGKVSQLFEEHFTIEEVGRSRLCPYQYFFEMTKT